MKLGQPVYSISVFLLADIVIYMALYYANRSVILF